MLFRCLIYMWVKKCVKMCISIFKMFKKLLEMGYQTGLNLIHRRLKEAIKDISRYT